MLYRGKDWVVEKKMGSFLSVNQGSYTELRFLEVSYTGGATNVAPLALVGKGITFDTWVSGLFSSPREMCTRKLTWFNII